MHDTPNLERREAIYSGNVQGVGFRYTVRQISQKYRVTGFVKNLSDGRVQLVAEGEPAEIGRFLGAVDAAMSENIREIATTTSPASGEFDHFGIRH
jgi:acylphosphatase